MKILVCGDRNWSDVGAIRRELSNFSTLFTEKPIIIHGGARGADTIAGEIAKELGFEVLVFPAEWVKFGRAAGPIRNKQMIDQGQPDFVFAFHKNIEHCKGTKNMVQQAKVKGLKVTVFTN